MNDWTQYSIFICGVTAMFLANETKPERRRWAPVIGLLGQPAWYVMAAEDHRWGLFAVSFLYTAAWARGFYLQWIKA